MNSSDKRPLVTFALFVYNQERLVREAVLGALAQTYSPLQIVISDDCSTDGTFDIVTKMLSGYSGPHEILLNRNEKNLGTAAHVNRMMKLVKGDLVVSAAGDDISFPERTSVLAEKWIELDRRPDSIHSAAVRMDMHGNSHELLRKNGADRSSPFDVVTKSIIMGSTHAWTKKVFSVFGDLNKHVVHEDITIIFRSSLLGGVFYLDRPLVKYREGGISDPLYLKCWEHHDTRMKHYSRSYWDCRQHLEDLEKVKDVPPALENILKRKAMNYKMLMEIIDSPTPCKTIWNNKRNCSFAVLRGSTSYLFPWIHRIYQKIIRPDITAGRKARNKTNERDQ